jgi:hypothetical protein
VRPRLRKLVNLVGIEPDLNRPPEPDDAELSVKRVDERSADEAKRRLEQTRERLKAQIPPPPA